MTRIACPSEAWDRHCDGEEEAAEAHRFADRTEAREELDPYGNGTYVVGWHWEDDTDTIKDRGDWQAYLDFQLFTEENEEGIEELWVAYMVTVNSESGSFIESPEKDEVFAANAPYGLADYWLSIGLDGAPMLSDEEQATNEKNINKWQKDLRVAIRNHPITLANWDWRRDGIKPPDAQFIGDIIAPSQIVEKQDKRADGGRYVIIRRNTAGLPKPQDPYRKLVIDYDNRVTHDFGTVPNKFKPKSQQTGHPVLDELKALVKKWSGHESITGIAPYDDGFDTAVESLCDDLKELLGKHKP